jgi:hypothetical protein
MWTSVSPCLDGVLHGDVVVPVAVRGAEDGAIQDPAWEDVEFRV